MEEPNPISMAKIGSAGARLPNREQLCVWGLGVNAEKQRVKPMQVAGDDAFQCIFIYCIITLPRARAQLLLLYCRLLPSHNRVPSADPIVSHFNFSHSLPFRSLFVCLFNSVLCRM